MNTDFDILIIGGGMVGASLACALSRQPLRIGVVEARTLDRTERAGNDERAITMAHSTQQILSAIGVWDPLAIEATPIHRIHVSDRGYFGFARLDRDEEGVEALGYVVPARVIGATLMAHLQQQQDIDFICPAQLERVNISKERVTVQLSRDRGTEEKTARLIVAADGTQSVVREQLSMAVDRWDYGQTAVVASIGVQLPHRNIAYERFTDTGPLAVLPRADKRCTFVWTVKNDQVDRVLAFSDEEFLQNLQERFGYRLGRLENPGRRGAYPLQLVRAKQVVHSRVALVGNAAHTLHPIAGQGFNLGIRDVAALAEVLVDSAHAGKDIGSDKVLEHYAQWRKRDHKRVTAFTDGLMRLFANPLVSVAAARNLGMLTMDAMPPAKRFFTRLAMGRSGKSPRLSRGLPL